MRTKNALISNFVLCMLFGLQFISTSIGHMQSNIDEDARRKQLIALENEWLANLHDATKLDGILASDFFHPVPTGDLLTKAQHISYSTKIRQPADQTNQFQDLKVRLYGDVGIANGIVVTTGSNGQIIRKSIFTDVFVYREERWQAVNAQENQVITH